MADETLKTTVLDDRHRAARRPHGAVRRLLACRCSIPPASSPSTNGPASTPACSTSRTWARRFLLLNEKTGDADADHRAVAALIEPLVSRRHRRPEARPAPLHAAAQRGRRHRRRPDGRPPGRPCLGRHALRHRQRRHQGQRLRPASPPQPAARPRSTAPTTGGLLALQGPEAVAVMADLVPGVADLALHALRAASTGATPCSSSRAPATPARTASRSSSSPRHAEAFWDALLADDRVKPIGLGARDSLRLEAGLPLYGHDLDETDLPDRSRPQIRRQQAPPRSRRLSPAAPASSASSPASLSRIRVGLLVEGAPARDGADILDAAGAVDRQGHQRRLLAHASTAPSPWATCRPRSPRPAPRSRSPSAAAPSRPRSPPCPSFPTATSGSPAMSTKFTKDHEYLDRRRHGRHHQLCAGPARRHRLRRAAQGRPEAQAGRRGRGGRVGQGRLRDLRARLRHRDRRQRRASPATPASSTPIPTARAGSTSSPLDDPAELDTLLDDAAYAKLTD